MLQQEGGIEITLEMLTVLHFVPTPGKRLFNIFTGQMVILADNKLSFGQQAQGKE